MRKTLLFLVGAGSLFVLSSVLTMARAEGGCCGQGGDKASSVSSTNNATACPYQKGKVACDKKACKEKGACVCKDGKCDGKACNSKKGCPYQNGKSVGEKTNAVSRAECPYMNENSKNDKGSSAKDKKDTSKDKKDDSKDQ